MPTENIHYKLIDLILGGYICNHCGCITQSETLMLDHVTKEHNAKVSKSFSIGKYHK